MSSKAYRIPDDDDDGDDEGGARNHHRHHPTGKKPNKGAASRPSRIMEGNPNPGSLGSSTTSSAPLYGYSEGTSLRIDQLQSKPQTPLFVYILTFFSAIGGFLFGYDTGVISGAMILLRDKFLLNSVWQELIVSVTIGAAALFALCGGFLNDRIGRKPVIIIASLIFTAGALCLGCATDRYLLLVGRIIVGAGIGLSSMTVPVYIAENAPTHKRGMLVVCYQLSITSGIFVAAILDGCLYYAGELGWRFMLGLGAVPSLIQFLGFLFMPESPRWLITKNKDEEARIVLQKIRGQGDIEEEFEAIKNSCLEAEREHQTKGNVPIIWHMLTTPSVRRALIIGCSLQMFQQIAGINTVMYYSATIIKMSGVKSESAAIWLSAVTAAVNFVFTFVGLYLVERVGRRPLTLASLIGAVISLAWLAIGFNLAAINSPSVSMHEPINQDSPCNAYQNCYSCITDLNCGYCYVDAASGAQNSSCLQSDYDNSVKATLGRCNSTHLAGPLTWAYDYCPTAYAWMPMVGLVMYLVFFSPGMGPMPWTINSEIYPLWARSTGNAAATFTNWMFNLAVSMSFLSLTEAITTYGAFWLYAGLATAGVIFLSLLLPETKGKSLEEVEGVFARPWCGSQGQTVPESEKSIQYVHIRGLNRDGRDSELDSPE